MKGLARDQVVARNWTISFLEFLIIFQNVINNYEENTVPCMSVVLFLIKNPPDLRELKL